jgi:hypothetical protein
MCRDKNDIPLPPATSSTVASEEQAADEHLLDEALEETFPASDPVAMVVPHGSSKSH